MPSANTNPLKSEERYKRIVAPFREEEKQVLTPESDSRYALSFRPFEIKTLLVER